VDGPDRSVWFVGDLDDPWVESIAGALPPGTRRLHAGIELPDTLPESPSTLVVHRAVLTRRDAERLSQLRARRSTRVILCFGPHVRYADLERWSEAADVVLPEATANETIARRISPVGDGLRSLSPLRPRPRIAVVSTNSALRETIVEACEALGYPSVPASRFGEAPPGGPSVWDVPVLEPDWETELSGRTKIGPVIAFLGFADRGLVTQARTAGAVSCLELPYELLDLAACLDRVTTLRAHRAQVVPPAPLGVRKPLRQNVVDPACEA
jgi:hypothetical protein